MYRVGLIGDDLTGALDAAAPFAQRGLTTRVVTQLQTLDQVADVPCEVLSINTDSRHLAVDQAVMVVSRACQFFAQRPPALIYKKIDSTLRGNVAAEIATTLNHSHRSRAIVTPALPIQGRTIRDGEVYVRGIPLQETAFMHDPVSAPVSGSLSRQLMEYNSDLAVSAGANPPRWTADAMQIWVADCSEQAELEHIARLALAQSADSVIAGSAGLAEALANISFGPPRQRPTFNNVAGPVFYVVGSRSPATLAQAEQLAALPGYVYIDAPAGQVDSEYALRILKTDPDIVLIQIPAEPVARPLLAAQTLGNSVAQLLEQITPAAVIVTGGDTAAALLNAIQQSLLELGGELLPDIPLCYIDHKNQPLPVITKAGGFGDAQVFVEIAALIKPSL